MKKLLSIILALTLVFALAIPGFASEDVESDLEAANNRQEELEAEVANSQARLSELQSSKADIEDKIAEIDSEIAQVDGLISQYNSEAEEKQGQIADMEEQIADKEDDIQDKYDKMKVRIKYMYENLDANYIEAIFSSTSFGEFFEKIEYIVALNNYDRNMMDEIERLKDEVEDNKAAVEDELGVVQALGDAQEQQRAVLGDLEVMKSGELANTEVAIQAEEAEMDAINAMLAENAANIAALSAEYDAMLAGGGEGETQVDPEAEAAAAEAEAAAAAEAEAAAAAQAEAERLQAEAEAAAAAAEAEARAQAEAESLEAAEAEARAAEAAEAARAANAAEAAAAQAAAQEAAAAQAAAQEKAEAARANAQASTTTTGGGGGTTTGSWIWPLSGYTTISSGFGYRSGAYAGFHSGIDIPAPTGTPIMAVDGGKVVLARWSPGADTGNYTVIYHGNGVYSEYMHQSNLYVSEGDVVSQGQVIGAVGSTGQSSGPHLHISKGIGAQYWLNRVAPF